MNPNFLPMLVKLSESDKKAMLVLLFVVVLLIIVIGYLQKLVGYIMYRQGLAVDTMMYDILRTGVIKKKREFRKEAYRKSMVLFCKKAWIPFVLVTVSVFAILIYGWAQPDKGLAYYPQALSELSFELDWPMANFFGLTIPNDWPSVVSYPDFSWSLDKYYAFFFTLVGGVATLFYLYQIQAYLSRCLRIRHLSRTYFAKDLNKHNNNAPANI